MKKIIELEGRWKAYKYKSYIFYIFILVFVVFLVFVGLFVKSQYQKYSIKSDLTKQSITKLVSNTSVLAKDKDMHKIVSIESDVNNKLNIDADSNISNSSNYPSINFVCRKVISSKLTVRSGPSFNSKPVGHYIKNGIFCAENKNVNGLVQTTNGWISANDKFSEIVKVNMFVDSGFHKYRDILAIAAQAPMQEVNVLSNRENIANTQSKLNDVRSIDIPHNIAQDNISNTVESKPLINISSEKITKEKEIEFKINDFKNTNSYDTAIEIAEYYFSIKDYNNSIRWSLNASEADSKGKTKAQSFIIYAKSLYANGKKEQAIDVLNRYIAKTNSRDAIEALKNIRQGLI